MKVYIFLSNTISNCYFLFSSNDSSTHIPTDKADVTTNKQPGAEFAIVNVDASQQKNTSTANSDKQEQKHYDESVPHANTENGRYHSIVR